MKRTRAESQAFKDQIINSKPTENEALKTISDERINEQVKILDRCNSNDEIRKAVDGMIELVRQGKLELEDLSEIMRKRPCIKALTEIINERKC